MRAEGQTGGRAVGAGVLLAAVLSAGPTVRLSGQDTSAVDRGVRIGILYRPGVRPGIVVLTGRAPGLDSVRTIMARDIDYSDRFELITLPGSDSIRLAAAPGPRPAAGTGAGKATGGATSAAGLNYPLYQALGADFAAARCGASCAPGSLRSPIRASGWPSTGSRIGCSRARWARPESRLRACCS